MPTHVLSADTQAVLLLCGSLGRRSGAPAKPLSSTEYARLAGWLHQRGLRPADLLSGVPDAQSADLPIESSRLGALLERGAALAFEVERWTNRGLWVISRGDDAYPRTLKTRLGRLAPPLLYGVGDPALLSTGGLAIVGSRDADADAERFATAAATRCAQEQITVVSGGARGVDSIAMGSALEAGGRVIGILTEALDRAGTSSRYRDALRSEALVLASPYDPGARFSVAAAMGRNKIVYALSCWSLVVSSAARQGGTWAGAVENLRADWVPLFVREGSHVPEGNRALRAEGGIPLALEDLEGAEHIGDLFTRRTVGQAEQQPEFPQPSEPNLFSATSGLDLMVDSPAEADGAPPADLFEIVWPHIQQALATPQSEGDLATALGLVPGQIRAWLARAVEIGRVRKRAKPPRYELAESAGTQLQLLDNGEGFVNLPARNARRRTEQRGLRGKRAVADSEAEYRD